MWEKKHLARWKCIWKAIMECKTRREEVFFSEILEAQVIPGGDAHVEMEVDMEGDNGM